MNLRPYQSDAVTRIRGAYADGYKRVLYVLPTAGGKRIIFTYITEHAAAKGTRTLILVHREELLEQAVAEFHALQPGGIADTGATVRVGMVQTVANRLAAGAIQPDWDFLVVDEAHHCRARSWQSIVEANPAARVLGVTATPERLDGRGLYPLYEHMIVGPQPRALMDDGYLAECETWGPLAQIDTTGIPTEHGDWASAPLEQRANVITGNAVASYATHGRQRPALAFCVNVAHATRVAEAFRAAGYKAACVHGKTPARERRAVLAQFRAGAVHVLTSVDLFIEGLDCPGACVALVLRPTQSECVHRQMLGRVLRVVPGKVATVIDHAGNWQRFGFADTPREWTLEAKPRRERQADIRVPAVRQCPACFRCHAPAPVCPGCGYRYEPRDISPREVPGELWLLTEREYEAQRVEAKRRQAKQARSAIVRAGSMGEAREIARAAGYSAGYAHMLRRAVERKRNARKEAV